MREASKVMDGATKSHWKYLMRIVKYVIDTKNYTLCHRVNYGDEAIIEGYCDSNYAGDKDTRRSVTGYAIYLNGCLIVWKLKSSKAPKY